MTAFAHTKETRSFGFSANTQPPNTESDVLIPSGSETNTSDTVVPVNETTRNICCSLNSGASNSKIAERKTKGLGTAMRQHKKMSRQTTGETALTQAQLTLVPHTMLSLGRNETSIAQRARGRRLAGQKCNRGSIEKKMMCNFQSNSKERTKNQKNVSHFMQYYNKKCFNKN